MSVRVFRGWCLDEGAEVTSGQTTDGFMSACPNDANHKLDADSVTIVSETGLPETDESGDIVPASGAPPATGVPKDLEVDTAKVAKDVRVGGDVALGGALSGTSATFTDVSVKELTRVGRMYAEDALLRNVYPNLSSPWNSRSWVVCASWLWRRGDTSPTAFYVRGTYNPRNNKTLSFRVLDTERNVVLGTLEQYQPVGNPVVYSCKLEAALFERGSDVVYTIEAQVNTDGRRFECDSMALGFVAR